MRQDDHVLWPVLVDREPMTDAWYVGGHVSPRLMWQDSPALPDDLVLRDVSMRARPLRGPDGRPWGQLLRTGEYGQLLPVEQWQTRGFLVAIEFG